MLRRLVLACTLTTIVLASVPAISSATSIPGPNGKIAFTSARGSTDVPDPNAGDAGARIYVADWPFGTPVQVTTVPSGAAVRHRQPSWSPDHTRIAYAANPGANYGIWIVDLRTGAQKEFVAPAAMTDRPSWSPDGTKIAYGSQGDLWVKDADAAVGDPAVQLTNGAAVEERPVWSPDGNTLYYNLGPVENRDIYSKSPVTPGGAEVGLITTSGKTADDWQVAVSPDGKRLCFLRGQQDNSADIFTSNVNGTGVAAFASNAGIGELNCVWSPDGTRVLFTEGIFSAGEIRSRDINKGSFNLHAGFSVAGHFDGNTDWATNFSPTCDAKTVNVGVNAFVSIPLSCTDPDSGFGKAAPTPDALSESSMEIVSQPKNGTIGSISDDEKVVYTPNKDFKGTDSFTYLAEDNESASKPATVTIQVANPPTIGGGGDKTAPSISGLKVSVKKWRLGKGLATISKSPVGTNISFSLSEAAAATVSFQRSVPAKKGGKPRFVNAGSLKALAAKAGKNKVRFQGRLTASRSLAPGTYRVVVKARDAAGNQSPPRNGPKFTIVSE